MTDKQRRGFLRADLALLSTILASMQHEVDGVLVVPAILVMRAVASAQTVVRQAQDVLGEGMDE